MIRFLEGEGYVILFAIVAFGLPMAVWSLGEEWAKNSESKSLLMLIACGLAFALGVILVARIVGFVEG